MHIQSYQIHNVLNVYRRQLSQAKPGQNEHVAGKPAQSDTVRISAEGKNQSILEKVADNVLKKITNFDPESEFDQQIDNRMNYGGNDMGGADRETTFTFNTIRGNNQKETQSIAVDDTQILMNRLNELAKAAVDHKSK
jgi:hypothetical protein